MLCFHLLQPLAEAPEVEEGGAMYTSYLGIVIVTDKAASNIIAAATLSPIGGCPVLYDSLLTRDLVHHSKISVSEEISTSSLQFCTGSLVARLRRCGYALSIAFERWEATLSRTDCVNGNKEN